VSPAKTAEPIEMPLTAADSRGPRERRVLDGVHLFRRHLASAIERPLLGGDAACHPGAVLRGTGKEACRQPEVWPALPTHPNQIFGECNWTSGMKIQ